MSKRPSKGTLSLKKLWRHLARFTPEYIWNSLGSRNAVVLLAGIIGMAAGILAVLLKNGVGWLRKLPSMAGGNGTEELLFALPIIGLVLTHAGPWCFRRTTSGTGHSLYPSCPVPHAGQTVADVHDQPRSFGVADCGIRRQCRS